MTWTPNGIHGALCQHHSGEFGSAVKLATAMLQDDELPEDLSVSTNLIVGADFRLEPIENKEGEPDAKSQAVSDDWEDRWQAIHPPVEMAKMFNWYEMVGVALGVYDWNRVDGAWAPKFRALNPENLEFRDGEVDPQTGLHGAWVYRARSGDEVVTPGDGRWVLFSEGRESWISCAIRALGFAWLIKQQTNRDLARYNERHGLPIVIAKVPAFSPPETAGQVLADVKSLGSGTTIAVPSHMVPESGYDVGFEFDLLEAKDQAFEVFFKTLDRIDRKFKMYFLGTNTAELEGTAGSRATQSSGRAIMMQKAQERYNRVRSFIREQMLVPLLPLMGTTIEDELVPNPVYLIEGDEDMRERAETVEVFGKALNQLKTAGYELKNIEQEAANYGLELEEKEEPEPEPVTPGPQPPNAPKPQADKQAALDAIGASDGFENGQNYIDGLINSLTAEAEELEKIDAEEMVEILDGASNPSELYDRVAEHLNGSDPVLIAGVFEKAMTLGTLGGQFSVQEDL